LETAKLPDRASGKFDPIKEYDAFDRLNKVTTVQMKILTKINQQKSQSK